MGCYQKLTHFVSTTHFSKCTTILLSKLRNFVCRWQNWVCKIKHPVTQSQTVLIIAEETVLKCYRLCSYPIMMITSSKQPLEDLINMEITHIIYMSFCLQPICIGGLFTSINISDVLYPMAKNDDPIQQ